LIIKFLLTLFILFIWQSPLFAKTPPNNYYLKQGQRLFRANCSSCHRANFKIENLNKEQSIESIEFFISKHKKTNISKRDILKISIYIKSLL
jgi:mono/diheme cytochrome c family protein